MPPAPRPGVSAVTLPRATLAPPTSVVPTSAAPARVAAGSAPTNAPIIPKPTVVVTGRVAAAYTLRIGDPLIISLRGIPKEEQIEDQIDEDGEINMPFLGSVRAAGLTSGQLEDLLERLYIQERQIYRHVSINVVIPARSYFVRGEVRAPGKFQLVSGVTVVQAIAAAGGYTEFAKPSNVTITRGSKTFEVDARQLEQHPERDIPVEAGDVIVVGRTFF